MRDAGKAVEANMKLPPGYWLAWAGQYRYLERAKAKLAIVVAGTLVIIFLLLFFNSRSAVESIVVLLAAPFSLVGAFWLIAALGYNLSVAVWVRSSCSRGWTPRTRSGTLREDLLPCRRLRCQQEEARERALAARPDWQARGRIVDLVVVGHRERSALARMLIASVANRLLEICPKPVLVVRGCLAERPVEICPRHVLVVR